VKMGADGSSETFVKYVPAIRCDIPEGSDLEVRKCTDSIRLVWQSSEQMSRYPQHEVWSELAKQFSDYEMEQRTNYYYYYYYYCDLLIVRNKILRLCQIANCISIAMLTKAVATNSVRFITYNLYSLDSLKLYILP
jgi:hypothetical protein